MHFGICFNLGLIYLQKSKVRNSEKWFRISTLIDPNSEEAFLGLAISTLKLGKFNECLDFINNRPNNLFKMSYKK